MYFEIEQFRRFGDGTVEIGGDVLDDWSPAIERAQAEWAAYQYKKGPELYRGFSLHFGPRDYAFSRTIDLTCGMHLVGSGGGVIPGGTYFHFPPNQMGMVFRYPLTRLMTALPMKTLPTVTQARTGGQPWTFVPHPQARSGERATVVLSKVGEQSDYLIWQACGFDIPDNAVVTGVRAVVLCHAIPDPTSTPWPGPPLVFDTSIELWMDGKQIGVEVNKSWPIYDPVQDLPLEKPPVVMKAYGVMRYGGVAKRSDPPLWGADTLPVPKTFRDKNKVLSLKIAIVAGAVPAPVTAQVDGVYMAVFYAFRDFSQTWVKGRGQGAVVERIRLLCPSTPASDNPFAHGIWIQDTAVVLRDMSIWRFGGNGIHIEASAHWLEPKEPPAKSDALPIPLNANGWQVQNVFVHDCLGDGLHAKDSDANAGCAIALNVENNQGWGVFDGSELGNTYVACQAAGNKRGAYSVGSVDGSSSVLLGCYSEDGQLPSTIDANSVAIGGAQAARCHPMSKGFIVPSSGKVRPFGVASSSGIPGERPIEVRIGGGGGYGSQNALAITPSGITDPYFLRYGPTDALGESQAYQDRLVWMWANARPVQWLSLDNTRNLNPGETGFPNGAFFGKPGKGEDLSKGQVAELGAERRITFMASPPDNGIWYEGDIVFSSHHPKSVFLPDGSRGATPAEPDGWRCTATGAFPDGGWSATTLYSRGALVYPPSNDTEIYVCIGAGTSGSKGPSGKAAEYDDGGVKWRYLVLCQARILG